MGMGRGPRCVCYWGFGNPGNIIVWIAVAISFCLGLGLIIGGAVDGHDCFQKNQDCRNAGFSQEFCQDVYNRNCNLSKYQGILGSGIIILFFITPLLTIYFCCCATRPNDPNNPQGTAMVVMSQAVPGGYPQQPGYGGYPPPPPGYYPQAAPGPYPPGAYPQGQYPAPMGYPPAAPGAYPPQGAYAAYPPAANPSSTSGPSEPVLVSGVPYSAPPPKQV